jgi:hypothetical protein
MAFGGAGSETSACVICHRPSTITKPRNGRAALLNIPRNKRKSPSRSMTPELTISSRFAWTGAGADRNSQNPWLRAADLRSRRLGNHEHQSRTGSRTRPLGPRLLQKRESPNPVHFMWIEPRLQPGPYLTFQSYRCFRRDFLQAAQVEFAGTEIRQRLYVHKLIAAWFPERGQV